MKSAFIAGMYEALSFGQQRMKAAVAELTPEQLAQVPNGMQNSIATLVVHTAGVEANFAHRFLGQETPADLKAEYLLDQPQSPLPAATGETVESLVAKMEKGRAILHEALSQLTDADLDKEWVSPAGKAFTYRYLLSILPNHQALHTGHIQYLKRLNEA